MLVHVFCESDLWKDLQPHSFLLGLDVDKLPSQLTAEDLVSQGEVDMFVTVEWR